MNHNKGSFSAMAGQNEVVYTVRVGHERFEIWRIGVCSLMCENEQIALLNKQGIRMTVCFTVNHPSKR